MAKRTLKRAPKSGKPAYANEDARTHFGVREVSAVTCGHTRPAAAPPDHRSVPATQAKNRFGEILQTVRDSGPVFIERHGQAQAVVLGIDTYNKLISNERSSQERELDYWTREFNVLHARMQTQESRQAVDELFSATDAELNRQDT